jgi:glutaminyl-tRNA synthetase
MRRRGYPAAAIRDFLGAAGVSKAQNRVEFAMLEHFVREHLKESAKTVMCVLEPLKVVIENYPEGECEWLDLPYGNEHGNAPEQGAETAAASRQVPFSREIFIEKSDFMEEPEKKFFRLAPGKEVRLKGAYAILCTGVVKNDAGEIIEVRATYDPLTKSSQGGAVGGATPGNVAPGEAIPAEASAVGSVPVAPPPRKIKGVLHWVSAAHALPVTVRLYDTLVTDDDTAEAGVVENPHSLVVMDAALAEPALANATAQDRFQFMRQGYFCPDEKATANNASGRQVYNRIVGLKSSYKK